MNWLEAKNALRAKLVMDIAAKYQVANVRPFIVNQLTAEWPKQLLPWLLRHNELKTAYKVISFADDSLFNPDEHFRWVQNRAPDPASAIRIALDHNIPSILPVAFYTLCQVDAEADYNRWEHEKWSFECQDYVNRLDTFTYSDRCYDHGIERLARWDLVDRDSMYRLAMGKRALTDTNLNLSSVFVSQSKKTDDIDHQPEECKTKERCRAERVRLEKVHRLQIQPYSMSGNDSIQRPDPLARLWGWWEEEDLSGDLCESCAVTLKQRIRDKMEQIWEDLPHMFHLDSLKLGQSVLVPVALTYRANRASRSQLPLDRVLLYLGVLYTYNMCYGVME